MKERNKFLKKYIKGAVVLSWHRANDLVVLIWFPFMVFDIEIIYNYQPKLRETRDSYGLFIFSKIMSKIECKIKRNMIQ